MIKTMSKISTFYNLSVLNNASKIQFKKILPFYSHVEISSLVDYLLAKLNRNNNA